MLSAEEIKHIALLARVGLSEDEIPKYQRDLSRVLDWFDELKAVPTDDVTPIGHVTQAENATRLDAVVSAPELERTGILGNIPSVKEEAVKVRSVF